MTRPVVGRVLDLVEEGDCEVRTTDERIAVHAHQQRVITRAIRARTLARRVHPKVADELT